MYYVSRFVLLFICFFVSSSLSSNNIDSIAFSHAKKRLDSLNYEARHYVKSNQEILLLLSRYQDALLTFLRESENAEVYIQGMQEIYNSTTNVRHCSFYGLKEINFYNFALPEMVPQCVTLDYNGSSCTAFYNTFKLNHELNPEEREKLFLQEEKHYLRDAICAPFTVDEEVLKQLEPEKIYNFVLLPDGIVRFALERPDQRQYHVDENNESSEKFTHPNHSILAGSGDQIVISAGAITFFESNNKRLYFVSNKSGHYRPLITSLDEFRKWLKTQGVDESLVILLPDVDISKFLLEHYTDVEIPVSITQQTSANLFEIAKCKWQNTLECIDKSALVELSNGNFDVLTPEFVSQITQVRDELTYMRSAYRLFLESHKAPKPFNRLVKRLGKLKDAVKHNVPKKIQSEAAKFLILLEEFESRIEICMEPLMASEASTFYFLQNSIARMNELISKETLSIDEFHKVKKSARELGTLFLLLSLNENNGRAGSFFMFRNAASAFFKINLDMGKIHDEYIGNLLNGNIVEDKVYTTIPLSTKNKLKKHLDQIDLEPLTLDLSLNQEEVSEIAYEAFFSFYLAHFDMVLNVWALVPLYQIVDGEPVQTTPFFEQTFIILRNCATLAARSCELLSTAHKIPDPILWYISQTSRVLAAIPHNTTAVVDVKVDNMEPFTYAGLVGYLYDDVYATTPEDLNNSIHAILQEITFLSSSLQIDKVRLESIYGNVEQLAVLFELIKRARVMEKKHHDVVYDSISRILNALLVEIEQIYQSDVEFIEVSDKIRDLANHIADKLPVQLESHVSSNESLEHVADSGSFTIIINEKAAP